MATADGKATPKAYTSKDLAKDIVAKKKPKGYPEPKRVDKPIDRYGDDNVWSSAPYYRATARPPRKDPPAATPNTSGGFKFNPKAKLDTSQVRDRRLGSGNEKGQLEGPQKQHPPARGYKNPDPKFKWNPNLGGPPHTSDIVSTVIDKTTPMEKVINLQKQKRLQYERWERYGK